jgi:hypothetical protein
VQVNLKDELLLARGWKGQIAWDMAVGKGKTEIL